MCGFMFVRKNAIYEKLATKPESDFYCPVFPLCFDGFLVYV